MKRHLLITLLIFAYQLSSNCPCPAQNSWTINWDRSTETYVYHPQTGGAYYPRLIKLANGNWLCVFDALTPGASTTDVLVYRSQDNGTTWTYLSKASFGTGSAANGQITQLTNGDLLCTYRLVNEPVKTLKVSRSSNNGLTWQHLSTIIANTDGVWEPHIIQKPDNQLLVFYAQDQEYEGCDQVIEMQRSDNNGLTWHSPQVISKQFGSRDGMPVPAILANGDLYVVLEGHDPNRQWQFCIWSVRSSNGGDTWGPRKLVYQPPSLDYYAAAPYTIECNPESILVSYQTNDVSAGVNRQMGIVGSLDNGATWQSLPMPFIDQTNIRYSWNSLMSQATGQVVAATSIGGVGPDSIKLVKGTVHFEPVINVSASHIYGLLGEPVKLSADYQSDDLIDQVEWFRNTEEGQSVLMPASQTGYDQQSTQITFPAAAEENAGQYFCRVHTRSGLTSESPIISLSLHNGIVHRYTFDEPEILPGDPSIYIPDIIGGPIWQAKAIQYPGVDFQWDNGMITLGNDGAQYSNGAGDGQANGNYIDLPNGIVSHLGTVASFECWFVWDGPASNNWQRVFDFGQSALGEDLSDNASGQYNLFVSPRAGSQRLRGAWRNPAQEKSIDSPAGPVLVNGGLNQVVLVCDGYEQKAVLYWNGQLAGAGTLDFKPADMDDRNNWLGRSQWGDPLFNGRYADFRIYDYPLSDEEILSSWLAGPNHPGFHPICTEIIAGDINHDCYTDLNDLMILSQNWLIKP